MEELKEETAAKVTAEVTAKVTAEVTAKVTAENNRKVALRLVQSGELSLEKIAAMTDLPLAEVQKLAEQNQG